MAKRRRLQTWGQQDDPTHIMARTEAAVAFVNQVDGRRHPDLELDAFMSIFHPEVFADKKRMRGLHAAQREK